MERNIETNTEAYLMAACDEDTEQAVYKVKIIETNEDYVTVVYEDGKKEEGIPQSELLPIDSAAESGMANLTQISSLNEASVLLNLQTRFLKGHTYTNLHKSLVSINPYKKLYKNQCSFAMDLDKSTPSLDLVISNTLSSLGPKPQSIILCGQSGSGKTYNFKNIIFKLLESSTIYGKVISSIKLIQYFCNAGTIINTNSTRILLSTKIYYENTIAIGGIIRILHIDKGRITSRNKHEMNFHIFYMLKYYKNDDNINELFRIADNFSYLGGKMQNPDKKMNKAMRLACELGMDKEILWVFRVLAGILALGNVKFVDKIYEAQVQNASGPLLRVICKLFCVEEDKLMKALMTCKRVIGKTEIVSKLCSDDCCERRDFLARFLYEKVVFWLCDRVNGCLNMKNVRKNLACVQVFDLFGSEDLGNNSFEQLAINYANERMQDFIVRTHYCDEFDERPEDLGIKFLDIKPIIELIDDRNVGVFRILDESCSAKNFQESFCKTLQEKHLFNDYFEIPNKSTGSFVVHHSFRSVEYNASGMKAKNIDNLNEDFSTFSTLTTDEDIKNILEKGEKHINGTMRTSKFLRGLNDIFFDIEKNTCHIIYCIKPNENKTEGKFNQRLVLEQIQQFSLLDFIVFYRKVLKVVIPISEFKEKYTILAYRPKKIRRAVENFLKSEKIDVKDIEIDKKSISLPEAVLEKFQKSYNKTLKKYEKSAKTIQNFWRCQNNKNSFRKIRNSIIKIQAFYKTRLQQTSYQNQKNHAIKIQRWYRKIYYKNYKKNQLLGLEVFFNYIRLKIETKFVENCEKLALTCQKLWSGYKVRKSLKELLVARRMIDIVVNRAWVVVMRNLRKKSAITIQRYARGFLCRANLPESMRSFFEFKSFLKRLIFIQKHIRSFIIRKKYKQMKSSAIFIQNFWRGHLQHKKYNRMITSTGKIQRRVRCYLVKIRQIKLRLVEFLAKEQNLLENTKFLETSNLINKKPSLKNNFSSQELAQTTFFSINSPEKSSGLSLNGSLSRLIMPRSPSPARARKNSPFRLEKIYFFTRVLEIHIMVDTSIIYEPLWTTQYMDFVKACKDNKEYVADIKLGMCHCAGLTSKGNVYVWGWNDYNQCGRQSKNPQLLESFKGKKITQISCGDEHTIVKNNDGEVWSFGDNSKGQLGQGHYKIIKGSCKVQVPVTKQVCAVGAQNIVLSEDGAAFIWPYDSAEGVKQSFPVRILENIAIDQVSAGFNFAIFLALSGTLFSFGCNTEGQLGLGDCLYRRQPTLIGSLKKQGEKIIEISCGFDHVIARSTLGKTFTWGAGHKGQLGHCDNIYENLPRTIVLKSKLKSIQVAAGWGVSYIMLENRRIYSSGGKTNFFREVNFNETLAEYSNPEEFGIVKIYSNWSRVASLTLAVFADIRSLQTPQVKLQNQLNSLATKWEKNVCVTDINKLT